MQIAIRMDDITPDMDWERFLTFKAILDQYQVKPLIGVVPDNRDDNLIWNKEKSSRKNETAHSTNSWDDFTSDIPRDFWAYVKELQEEGWVVAMHGFCHCYTSSAGGSFPLNDFSEFAGLPYNTQYQMLQKGKQLLEENGIETDMFMAPAHSYDQNTLRALKELGFTKLTDGFGDKPYSWKGLQFYPISFKMSQSLKKKEGFTTMVIHAATMNDKDMDRVRGYLENPGDTKWISYKDYLKEPCQNRGFFGYAREFILAKCKFCLVRLRSK